MAATGVAGVLATGSTFVDGAAHFLFHFDRRLLDVRGAEAAEIIRRLQAGVPGVAIHVAERLQVGRFDPEVHRLRLVDPLLPARGGVDRSTWSRCRTP